jgi:hypothetical protein
MENPATDASCKSRLPSKEPLPSLVTMCQMTI